MYKMVLFVFTISISIIVFTSCNNSNQRYQEAIDLIYDGRYAEAATIFESLGNFEDALTYLDFANAMVSFVNGDYEIAKIAFGALGEFLDAAARMRETEQRYLYREGHRLFNAGYYLNARNIFLQLNEFNESAVMVDFSALRVFNSTDAARSAGSLSIQEMIDLIATLYEINDFGHANRHLRINARNLARRLNDYPRHIRTINNYYYNYLPSSMFRLITIRYDYELLMEGHGWLERLLADSIIELDEHEYNEVLNAIKNIYLWINFIERLTYLGAQSGNVIISNDSIASELFILLSLNR